MSKVAVYLRLGRVSNVPTVWSNVVAGVLLAGGSLGFSSITILSLALSLFYIGGMFLNDAYDREIDAVERPERPIPAGDISAAEVFAVGYGLMVAGVVLIAIHAYLAPVAHGWRAVVSGVALGGAVVLYNSWHKGNVISPFLMGLCRVLVYVTAALATTGTVSPKLFAGVAMLLGYLIGLTYIAKQENLAQIRNLWPVAVLVGPLLYTAPAMAHGVLGVAIYAAFVAWVLYSLSFLLKRGKGQVRKVVVSLIAGMSLLDAALIVSVGSLTAVMLAVVAFAATLFFQRYVSGT